MCMCVCVCVCTAHLTLPLIKSIFISILSLLLCTNKYYIWVCLFYACVRTVCKLNIQSNSKIDTKIKTECKQQECFLHSKSFQYKVNWQRQRCVKSSAITIFTINIYRTTFTTLRQIERSTANYQYWSFFLSDFVQMVRTFHPFSALFAVFLPQRKSFFLFFFLLGCVYIPKKVAIEVMNTH